MITCKPGREEETLNLLGDDDTVQHLDGPMVQHREERRRRRKLGREKERQERKRESEKDVHSLAACRKQKQNSRVLEKCRSYQKVNSFLVDFLQDYMDYTLSTNVNRFIETETDLPEVKW